MATAQQIIALLHSHNQGDEEQFLSIALQVAASEARRGRAGVSEELKRLVESARQKQIRSVPERIRGASDTAIPLVRPKGDLEGLLTVSYPKARLDDLVLNAEMRDRLERLIAQQLQREKLRAHSQTPKSKLLLIGPPGSGKTSTASILSGELHLPLFTIRLDAVITRFMGETAAKLRLIFDQISAIRGVYLFDEFDAIGGKRGADNDVGEMRRVLNSFLQFLEESNSTDSVVIAATNHPELLDRALFRRFDDILEFSLPSSDDIRRILAGRLGQFLPKRVAWSKIEEAAVGLSQAEVVKSAVEVIKAAILSGKSTVTAEEIVSSLRDRQSLRNVIVGIPQQSAR